jgi:BRCT domain type II-containing protein
VLRLLAEGGSNHDVADALSISLRTAGKHVENTIRSPSIRARSAVSSCRRSRAGSRTASTSSSPEPKPRTADEASQGMSSVVIIDVESPKTGGDTVGRNRRPDSALGVEPEGTTPVVTGEAASRLPCVESGIPRLSHK